MGTPFPDLSTRRGIGLIAGARAHGWRLLAELLSPPTPDLVERLRSGELVEEMREATAWLGPDADRFLAAFASLDAFARRSRRVSPQEDLDRLAAEYHRLFPDGTADLLDAVRDMAPRCDAEAQAWFRGDEAARTMRSEQHRLLEATLVDTLPAWCADLDERTRVMTYRSVARLATSYLSVESGRDFDRAVFGPL